MTKREPKPKLQISTRKARPKGQGFSNLRTAEQIESIPFEELIAPLGSTAPERPNPGSPPPGRRRPADGVHPGRPGPGSPASEPPALNLPPTLNLWSTLPQVEGHLKLPNIIVDHLYQLLDVQERSVYTQLYRLSHGYGKPTCKIGFPKLAARSGMARTTAIQTVERLIKKGLIARVGKEVGGKSEQGSVYWVSAPGSTAPERPGPGSPPPAPNKIKELKENKLKGDASHQRRDFSECPDCGGTGFYYPNGFDGGVAKCRHERLTQGK